MEREVVKKLVFYMVLKSIINEILCGEVVDDGIGFKKLLWIIDREDDYWR